MDSGDSMTGRWDDLLDVPMGLSISPIAISLLCIAEGWNTKCNLSV